MKKLIFLLAILLALAAVVTACGKAPGGKTGEPATTAGASESASTLYAEVVDIISNQVSVKVLTGSVNMEEMAARMTEMQSRRADGGGRTAPAGGDSDAGQPRTRNRGEMQTDADGQFVRPTGADGQPVTMPPATDENGETVTRRAFDPGEKYTGEEKEFYILTGTPIVKYSLAMPDFELKKTEAQLGDIKPGMTLNILYDGGGAIKEVQIIDMGFGGGMGGGFPAGGGAFIRDGGDLGQMPAFPPDANVNVYDMGDGRMIFQGQAPGQ